MPALGPKLQDIAARQLALDGDRRFAVAHRGDAADQHAAVVGPPVAHDVVAALALEVGRREPARERLGEHAALLVGGAHVLPRVLVPVGSGALRARRLSGQHAIQNGTVHRSHRMHVVGRLHAALQLERRGARAHELWQQVDRAQIARREQVLARRRQRALARRVQLVREAAGLGAHAAVGGAPADQR